MKEDSLVRLSIPFGNTARYSGSVAGTDPGEGIVDTLER